jgi:prolyl 4-hydroxylase
VRQCDGFIAPEVCDWLIGLAQGRLKPAMMVEGYGAAPRPTTDRTNSDFAFTAFDADCVLALVRARISALVQLPVAAMEPPQLFHYAVGQELRPHVDYLQREGREAGAYQGDRIATFLIYLNDDFEGGETWFSRVELKARPSKGGAVYFANVDPAGQPDPMSLHAGLPPASGEKWLFSQWVHDRPFTG